MKYIYEIPPKLVKKNGFFGTISNYDIGMAAALAAAGFLAMLILQNLVGMVILLLCGASAYLFFIFQDRKSTRLNSSHTDSSRMPSSA